MCGAQTQDGTIEGVCLEKILDGKKVYSIEAQNATFGNKRMGFFDVAFIKVMYLDDVSFTLYKEGKIEKTQHLKSAVYELNTRRLFDEDGNVVLSEDENPKS
jgi:hypothetical protein